MARIKPQGSLSWPASESADVVAYCVYQGADGNPPTYDSPFVVVGNVLSVALPVEGLPPVEGTVIFGVSAIDAAANESDIRPAEAILIDVTPPLPPAEVVYSQDFL